MKNEIIEIKEEVEIGDVVLEKGDKIEVLKEGTLVIYKEGTLVTYDDLHQFIYHQFNEDFELAWESFFNYASRVNMRILDGWIKELK